MTRPSGRDGTHDSTRLVALGDELLRVHGWLRTELSRLTDEVSAHLDGVGDRPTNLVAHCLSFCTALHTHHTGEDAGAFPALAHRFPDLQPIIEKLEQDHVVVDGLLRDLRRLVEDIPHAPTDADATRIQSELAGLTAILQSHFSFEERRVVDALNSLPADAGDADDLFGIAIPRR